MLTPARLHFEAVMAQSRGNGENTLADLTAYEQVLHRLRVDKNRLKGIQNNKNKAEVKREILPDYQGWIDGVLAADSGQADAVLTTVMLWSIDAGNVAEALRLGEYAIRHKLAMHDNFDRTPAVVLIDEICDPVLAAFKASQSEAPLSADLLKALDGLTSSEDVPEPVRAKLWKAIGYTLRISKDTQAEALEYLRKAITEFGDIGVKRDIEILDRMVKAVLSEQSQAVEMAGSGAEQIPRSAVTAVTELAGSGEVHTVENAGSKTSEATTAGEPKGSDYCTGAPAAEAVPSDVTASAADTSVPANTVKSARAAGAKPAVRRAKTATSAAKKTAGTSKTRAGATAKAAKAR
ncbi:phage terminase small subunit [Pantoea ananatis]|uniref:phage terminase small subunit n=1 Tax=Pantoea ananas TaxID=553 RepID=UPI001B30BE6F|nr:phage terminase small subunit [Pantoea ananatis]